MHPILVKFGPVYLYAYGALVALGFGLAVLLIYKRAPRFGLDPDSMVDAAIISIVSGIVGARILYVLLNIRYYSINPIEILDLTKGGLVWYGGFLFSCAALIIYIRKKGLSFWAVTDLIVPYVALAQAIGRLGCFLNGCCYGIEAKAGYIFGVIFPGESALRHPTQIYSAFALFLIFIILRLWQDARRFEGEIAIGYCMLYSAKRFLMEFVRGDNPKLYLNLTVSQLISIAVFLAALLIFLQKAAKWKRTH